jgi:hypothetical protein
MSRRRSCVLTDVNCDFWFQRPRCRQRAREESSRQRRNEARSAGDDRRSFGAEQRVEA